MRNIKILLFSKKQNIFCDYAEAILKSYFKNEEFISVRGNNREKLSDEILWYRPEYIISFISPWIIPKNILESARKGAINFHPGSPEYPGIGCYNFALYENSKRYGVTVHYMEEKVDTGDIIMTSYFDMAPFDSVEILKLKSMNHLLYCFEKILSYILYDKPLPLSKEKWTRRPFTRKEMFELFRIEPFKHDKDEIEKRIRAATYPSNTGAFVMVAGHKFYLPYDERNPIIE